jgi:hypothetical protein
MKKGICAALGSEPTSAGGKRTGPRMKAGMATTRVTISSFIERFIRELLSYEPGASPYLTTIAGERLPNVTTTVTSKDFRSSCNDLGKNTASLRYDQPGDASSWQAYNASRDHQGSGPREKAERSCGIPSLLSVKSEDSAGRQIAGTPIDLHCKSITELEVFNL